MPSATHLSTGTSLTAAAPSRMTSSPSEGLRAGETHDRPKPLVAAWGQLQDPPRHSLLGSSTVSLRITAASRQAGRKEKKFFSPTLSVRLKDALNIYSVTPGSTRKPVLRQAQVQCFNQLSALS